MAHYLIKLTPYDKFFFGTGKEFGAENKRYFIQSGYFPQQTALLGLLRYQMLCQAGEAVFKDNKIVNKKGARELIGEKSFTVGGENDFKKINSLSPLFILKNGEEKLFPLNREFQTPDEEESTEKWIMRELSANDDYPLLQSYKAKNGLPDLLFSTKEKYKYDDIFESTEQVGIRKNYDGETEENAFYMQTFMRFKEKDTCFAFYAEIDGDFKSSSIVYLGGERQAFSMEVMPAGKDEYEKDIEKLKFQQSQNYNKVVLLSDAYFNKNLKEYCHFAITDVVGFTCLQANLETKYYYNIKKAKENEEEYKKENLHKSTQIELYRKGSVFYFKDAEKLKEFTEKLNNSEFYKIGYNHFKEINKK